MSMPPATGSPVGTQTTGGPSGPPAPTPQFWARNLLTTTLAPAAPVTYQPTPFNWQITLPTRQATGWIQGPNVALLTPTPVVATAPADDPLATVLTRFSRKDYWRIKMEMALEKADAQTIRQRGYRWRDNYREYQRLKRKFEESTE